MGERYMKESEIYRSFIDFWDKGKTFGECLDAVPKYTKKDILGEVMDVPTSETYGEHRLVLEQTEWIPVSERLPEKNVWVLVTAPKWSGWYVDIMRIDKYKEMFTDNIDYYDSIIAWMPLPKPYEHRKGANE